jgi:hypothetical protein
MSELSHSLMDSTDQLPPAWRGVALLPRGSEVFVLDPGRDGLSQIVESLIRTGARVCPAAGFGRATWNHVFGCHRIYGRTPPF